MYPTLQTILEPPATDRRRVEAIFTNDEPDHIPVITKCGRTLTIRPLTPDDAPILSELLAGLSAETAQRRFFRPLNGPDAVWREVERVSTSTPAQRTTLIATIAHDRQERAVALAELAYDVGEPSTAEFALVVGDDFQQEGLGTMLLLLLTQMAVLRGVRALRADMLSENRAIHKLVRSLDLPYTARMQAGTTLATIQLAPS